MFSKKIICWSQWPRGLRRRSVAARLLRWWFRIPPGAWKFFCCECCVLSGRSLCDLLITRPEESYRMWCVVLCNLETSRMSRPWSSGGCRPKKKYYFKRITSKFNSTNPKIRLDIRYPTRGCTKQSNIDIIQRFQNKVLRYMVNTLWYIRNKTSTETCKWMLCLAKSRGLHKSAKEDSTIIRTLRPKSSWTTRA